MNFDIAPNVALAVIALTITLFVLLLARRNIMSSAQKRGQDILLNLAVSPILPSPKKESKVSTPIREVVMLSNRQLLSAFFATFGVGIITGVGLYPTLPAIAQLATAFIRYFQ